MYARESPAHLRRFEQLRHRETNWPGPVQSGVQGEMSRGQSSSRTQTNESKALTLQSFKTRTSIFSFDFIFVNAITDLRAHGPEGTRRMLQRNRAPQATESSERDSVFVVLRT